MRKSIASITLLPSLLLVSAATAHGQDILTETTPGAGSITVPTGYEWIDVTVQCWSGGGGGGGGEYEAGGSGGGGGGGAYASNTYATLLPGAYNYLIGAGGAGGPSQAMGSAGGSTIWNYDGIQDINVTGGGGGYYEGSGGAAGLILEGTGFQGGSGGAAGDFGPGPGDYAYAGGGGGGSADPSGTGGNGGSGGVGAGGSGGIGYGPGGGGGGFQSGGAGSGSFPGGGGGGGGYYDAATPVSGGQGANGEIIITYTSQAVPEPPTLALLGVAAVGLFGWDWRQRLSSDDEKDLHGQPMAIFQKGKHP